MSTVLSPPEQSAATEPAAGEPAWDIALLFPVQGSWTEGDYLALDTRRLVELANGRLEVLPMPTLYHQLLVKFLSRLFDDHVVAHRLGDVLFAPLPVRLFPGTIREPDLVFLRTGRIRDPKAPVEGADLVVEVVNDGEENRRRDLVVKRDEYARAGIAEFWIVDPQEQVVQVLVLESGIYRTHAESRPGSEAASVLLPGFRISVTELFAVGPTE